MNRSLESCLRCWSRWSWWGIPLVLLAAVTLPHFNQGDWRSDTGWYSAIGLNAWRTGKLWSLESQPGVPYFNKPPLAILIHGWFLHTFGVSLAVARTPTLIAAAISVVCTAGVARSLAGRRAGLWAGIVLALSYEFFRRTREVSLDMWQLAFMLGAAWALVRSTRPRVAALGSGVLLGFALLCKPLTAVASIPLLGAWLLVARRATPIKQWIYNLLIMFFSAWAVFSPWHLAMVSKHNQAFTAQFFGSEIVDRATGTPMGGQTQHEPVWFYAVQILTSYWPWMIMAALGFAAMKSTNRRSGLRSLDVLGVIWAAGWFVLLTAFPDRRDRYALPIYAGLAWLAAVGIARLRAGKGREIAAVFSRWAAPAAAVIAAVIAVLPVQLQRPPNPQWGEFFAWLARQDKPVIMDGGFSGAPAARCFLETGRWPVPSRRFSDEIKHEPLPTNLILYHARGGVTPGANETVVFQSGDLTVTRLESPGWNPTPTGDPGERK